MQRIERLVATACVTGAVVVLTTPSWAESECSTEADCPAGTVCQPPGRCVPAAVGATGPATAATAPASPASESAAAATAAPAEEAELPSSVEPAEGELAAPPDPGASAYRVEYRGLPPAVWITGVAAFGASWGGTIIVAAAMAPEEGQGAAIGHAAIPLVGPWIMMSQDDTSDYATFVVLGGFLQGASAAMAILGGTLTRRHTVVGDEAEQPAAEEEAIAVTPVMGPTMAGVAAVGTF